MQDHSRDVNLFLEKLIKEPAVLVSSSFGSLVSLFTVAQAPEWVRAMVIYDPHLYIWRVCLQTDPSAGMLRCLEVITHS